MELWLCFANTVDLRINLQDFDVNNYWFINEAHFHLDGFTNKQNWYSQRVTVWCAISSHGILVVLDGMVTPK